LNYYPVFLNTQGRKAVVVGGGRVAERKALSLLKAGADVTVVSPSLTRRLLKEKSAGTIRHIPRTYRKSDLKGAFLVISATDSPETNRDVAGNAPSLVNVVDVPSECNFIAPSVVKRGPLFIAISSSGVSPALSKTIRMELEKLYGPEFSEYLRFIKKIRARAMSGTMKKSVRERFLKGIGSGKMLKLLREKGIAAAKDEVARRLSVAGKGPGKKQPHREHL